MIVPEGFGVRLVPPDSVTAEIIRSWRNTPEVSRFMEFREYITPQMQQKWLESLSEKPVEYFVIYFHGKPVGLIHLAHISREDLSAEAGLFIGEPEFRGTGAALGASVLLLDYAFENLQLKRIWAKVHMENKASEEYNSLLGFIPGKISGSGFKIWDLDSEDYRRRRNRLVALIQSLGQ